MNDIRRTWLAGLALILCGFIVLASAPAQEEPVLSMSIWFGTEMSIAPDEDGAGLWRCEAVLKDLGSDEVLSAPTIVFAAGEKAKVQSDLSSGMLWEFEVEVSGEGEAIWTSRVSMGDQVLSLGTGSIRLAAE